jgi:hypothetical protein
MNLIYVILGFISIGIGLYISIPEIKRFTSRQKDESGFKLRLLFDGFLFILLGLGMIYQNI